MTIKSHVSLVVLALAVAMAGTVPEAHTLDRAPDPPMTVGPASLAPLLEDALNRVLPELRGPGLPELLETVGDLVSALESPNRAGLRRAAERARRALAAFESGEGGYFATDLDVVRLAIGAATVKSND